MAFFELFTFLNKYLTWGQFRLALIYDRFC